MGGRASRNVEERLPLHLLSVLCGWRYMGKRGGMILSKPLEHSCVRTHYYYAVLSVVYYIHDGERQSPHEHACTLLTRIAPRNTPC